MFLTTIVFTFTLSILILVHELGHFLAAKKAGIKVEEFGLGYPPRLLAKKIGETTYSLNWVFFGGFVKLYGEELEEVAKKSKRAFWAKSKKTRTAVILSGVVANFLLGVLIFSVIYSFLGIPTKTDRLLVGGVAANSPADLAGLKEGDQVVSLDGERVASLEMFVEAVAQKSGQVVRLGVTREKDNPCFEKVLGGGPSLPEEEDRGKLGFSCQDGNLIFFLTPREQPPEGEGPLGVLVSNLEIKKYPFWQMPFRGAVEGLKEAYGWTRLIVDSLGEMFVSLVFRGMVPKDIAGPVGIFQATGIVAQTGFLNIARFVGILSVNLAIVNVLPLPVLDGGKMVFVLYEVITRRRPKPKIERWANIAGLAMILTLMILVTINDVDRIVNLSTLWVQIKKHTLGGR